MKNGFIIHSDDYGWLTKSGYTRFYSTFSDATKAADYFSNRLNTTFSVVEAILLPAQDLKDEKSIPIQDDFFAFKSLEGGSAAAGEEGARGGTAAVPDGNHGENNR